MKIIDPIDNPTEAIMSVDIAARYGFAPTAAFAATRACAERRAHQLATTSTNAADAPGSTHEPAPPVHDESSGRRSSLVRRVDFRRI